MLDKKELQLGDYCPRLLIVDDQPVNIHLMHHIFAQEYEIFMATNGQQALDVCAQSNPDLILLDVVMPGMGGLELCKILKTQTETQTIPVIFITMLQTTEEETACWEAGCVDFVSKPVNPITLRNRVKVHLTLKFQAQLLRELAMVDDLTGIANHRCFEDRLKFYFYLSQRTNQPLSLMMIDVDFFKHYNDTKGHPAGDESLQKIAKALKANLRRASDLVARYGGEEFVCLLPGTDLKGALFIAEKLRASVQALNIDNQGSSSSSSVLTISIGVATYPAKEITTMHALVKAADTELYQAKQSGRNCVYGGESQ